MELVTPELGLLFWTVLTFAIVFFILAKFAWRPIIAAIREREVSIESALAAAENAKLEMSKLQSENEKLLEHARLERDRIIKEAQSAANNLITEAKDKASAESNRIVESAKQTIQNEKNAALTEVKNQVASLSIQIAEKIIRKQLADDASQKQLVNDLMNEIKLN